MFRSDTVVSCSGEVVLALGRAEDVCGVADGLPEFGDGAGGAAFEVGLELGEGHLDRVEIGAVGRQEAELGPDPVNGLADGGAAVGGKVVHYHDVAGLERWHLHLVYVGEEGGPMHGAVEHHGGGRSAQPQCAEEGGGLPVSIGHRRVAAMAVQSRLRGHVRVCDILRSDRGESTRE